MERPKQMKLINLLKSLPFIITISLILIINFTNQKEYTKLKVLFWDSPTLPLGTYLALSTGTGFLLSFIITSKIINNYQPKVKQKLKYRIMDKQNEVIPDTEQVQKHRYDNILIERNINEPSPTVNAPFRVIGNVTRNNNEDVNNRYEKYDISDQINESYEEYVEEEINLKSDKKINTKSSDWNDNTYVDW